MTTESDDLSDLYARRISYRPFKIAPRFRPKVSVLVLVTSTGALIVSPWPLIANIPFGWIASYVLPWALFLWLVLRESNISTAHRDAYANLLLQKNGRKSTERNKANAQFEFDRRSEGNGIVPFVAVPAWLYLAGCHIYVFSGEIRSYSSFPSAVQSVASWASLILLCAAMAIWAAALTAAVKSQGDLTSLFEERDRIFELPLQERNDLEIGRLKITLQAMIRRVEAYTIESTLLSALALSAFVGIAYSDRGPVESSDWISDQLGPCISELLLIDRPSCGAVANADALNGHIMYAVCIFMLFCAAFFMAVLVTRLRFNEGSRDLEEVVGALDLLNSVENREVAARRDSYTKEIEKLLGRAHIGLDSLRPTLGFMKGFRSLGISCFVAAIGCCGMLFGSTVSANIILIFVAAFAFSFVDKIRHNLSFIRKLESTMLGALRK